MTPPARSSSPLRAKSLRTSVLEPPRCAKFVNGREPTWLRSTITSASKLGLYTEVLRESVVAGHSEAIHQAVSRAQSPEEALRLFISGLFLRMQAEDRPAWNFRIMAHEMAQPTPALSEVINEVMRPRYLSLRRIIGEILHLSPDHATTRLCAHSVIGQVLHYVHGRPVIGILWPDLDLSRSKDLQLVSDHITDFTLRNLRALARQSKHKGKSQ